MRLPSPLARNPVAIEHKNLMAMRRRELMAKAQEIRLGKTKMVSSKYYRTADHISDEQTNDQMKGQSNANLPEM